MLSEVFRSSWANAVQLGALPLSVLGVLLTWIEVRKPVLAARITNLLLEAGRIRFPGRPVQGTGIVALQLFTLVHVVAFVAFWVWFLAIGASALPSAPLGRVAWVLVALVFPVGMAFLFVRVIAMVLRVLSSYSRGRPLGALGLLLAVVGIIAEVYQVATIFASPSD
jgi:hypothetical protein